MSLIILSTGFQRPNRLDGTPKDKLYHVRWGRYAAYNANNFMHQQYIARTKINKRFYAGEQWVHEEDLESFFKDESGQGRNRLKMIDNIVKPIIQQYLGNSIRMKINYKAKSVSPKCINRRDQKLNEMLLYTYVADRVPAMGEQMKKDLPIGSTLNETKQMFNNLYVDNFVSDINDLLTYVSENNKFEEKQRSIAEDLALSGLAVMESYEWNGHQYFERFRSEDYFWDRSAIEYDHNDAEYRGRMHYMNPTDIYEKYQDLTTEERAAIEKYATTYQKSQTFADAQMMFGGKIPVIKVYWRDTQKYDYGYVLDEYGYPYLTKIGFTYEGEKEPRYTMKDVIVVDSERSRKILKGKKTKKLLVDEMRYCIFIPQEILSSVEGVGDVVLDWGIVPYQQTDNLDISSVRYPFQSYCWAYIDGEVLSPVDDAISPQRFINRLKSVAENQINNSRGSGMVYDKDMLGTEDGAEEELLKNVNQSKPVGLHLRGRGVQNSVGSYDGTVSKGTMVMYDIMNIMKDGVKTSSGVNEALQGESMGGDQLVGVTQLMIQRGSLMQEPFYYAVSNIFMQGFQAIASTGKRIYADNDREIAIAIGDDGARILKISKDLKTEDFRVFIKRENSQEMLVESANNMMITLLQLKNADGTPFIDKGIFANLWNRSTPDDVARALRDSAKQDIEKSRMQQQVAGQQQQVAQQTQEGQQKQALLMQKHQEDREDQQQASAQDHDMDKIFAKGMVESVKKGVGQTQVAPNKFLLK